MKNEIYEKPAMKFVDIRSQQNVAAGNCWSQAANGTVTEWYYDYSGVGYLTFQLVGNCSGTVVNISATDVPANEMEAATTELMTSIGDSKFVYNATYFSPVSQGVPEGWS